MEKEVQIMMKIIIRKLQGTDKWGGSHTALRNITKTIPTQFGSTSKGKKIIQKAVKELVRKGFLLAKPSTGEVHVSLNPHKKKEIVEFRRDI